MKRFAAAAAVVALSALPALAEGPSDEEALAWAKKMETALRDRKPGVLDLTIDVDAIVERAFAGLDVTEKVQAGFLQEMRSQMAWGSQIANALGETGTLKLLRVVKRGDDNVVIFRGIGAGGLAYYELTLAKDASGRTRTIDMYGYARNTRMSAVMRQSALGLAMRQNKELLERLKGPEAEMARHLHDFRPINDLMKEKKWPEALAALRKLPESLQKHQTVLLFKLTSAKNTSPEEYKAVLDEIEKVHGQDPAFALTLLDQAWLDKNWKRVLAALDTLDGAVGGDAYLDCLRGAVRIEANELAEAKTAALRAVEREPDLAAAHSTLMTVALKAKDWPGVKAALERAEKHGVPIADIAKLPAYSEFVKTDEYAAWAKEHEKK